MPKSQFDMGNAGFNIRRLFEMVLRRKRHWVMAGFAILASLALVVGCTPTATPTTTATPTLTTTTATPTPTQVAGYPNADLLVETSWLGQHLGDAGIRIVDVRTVADYKAGHIQGAVSLPVEDTFDPAEPKMSDVGPVAQLEKVFGDRGISSDTRVIIYDGGKETKAGRLFWTLEYAGHTKVAYLNGGFTKWQKENLPVSTEETKVAAASSGQHQDIDAGRKADVLAAQEQGNVFVDTRTGGTRAMTCGPRGGHIPGTMCGLGHSSPRRCAGTGPPPSSEMYEDLGSPGIRRPTSTDSRTEVVGDVPCIRIMGYQNVRNYDGSWLEWGNDDTTPIE